MESNIISKYNIKNEKNIVLRSLIKRCIIDAYSGKCCICGYSKCNKVLQLHHIIPNEKEYGISDLHVRNMNIDSEKMQLLKTELSKCILVCANCHTEIHAGYIDIVKMELQKFDIEIFEKMVKIRCILAMF